MTKRPKASVVDLINLGTSGVNTMQLRNIKSGYKQLLEGQEQQTAAIQTIGQLQLASMYKLREVDATLNELSSVAWDISNLLERQEEKSKFVASKRIAIHEMEMALDEIDNISDEYAEYAALQAEILLELIEKHDVQVKHFAEISVDEMKQAQAFLDRANQTYHSLLAKLGE